MTLLAKLVQLILILLIFSPSNDSVFPEIDGFTKSKKIEIFNPDNLYDIINGAADSYLKYDFEELKLARYSGEGKQTLRIEIYRHSNSANAFGIYSNERPMKGNWIDIGAQGYYESKILNFYKGKYYIKLMGYKLDDSEKLLKSVAERLAKNLEGNNDTPKSLDAFPVEGKINYSGRFINKNFLGYRSLTEAFTVDYEIDGNEFKMFIMQKDSKKVCQKMLEDYFSTIKFDDKSITEGSFKVKDKYQGEIDILWIDNFVMGVLNSADSQLSKKHLESMSNNLRLN